MLHLKPYWKLFALPPLLAAYQKYRNLYNLPYLMCNQVFLFFIEQKLYLNSTFHVRKGYNFKRKNIYNLNVLAFSFRAKKAHISQQNMIWQFSLYLFKCLTMFCEVCIVRSALCVCSVTTQRLLRLMRHQFRISFNINPTVFYYHLFS